MFAGVLDAFLAWLCCSSRVARFCAVSSALLQGLLHYFLRCEVSMTRIYRNRSLLPWTFLLTPVKLSRYPGFSFRNEMISSRLSIIWYSPRKFIRTITNLLPGANDRCVGFPVSHLYLQAKHDLHLANILLRFHKKSSSFFPFVSPDTYPSKIITANHYMSIWRESYAGHCSYCVCQKRGASGRECWHV